MKFSLRRIFWYSMHCGFTQFCGNKFFLWCRRYCKIYKLYQVKFCYTTLMFTEYQSCAQGHCKLTCYSLLFFLCESALPITRFVTGNLLYHASHLRVVKLCSHFVPLNEKKKWHHSLRFSQNFFCTAKKNHETSKHWLKSSFPFKK